MHAQFTSSSRTRSRSSKGQQVQQILKAVHNAEPALERTMGRYCADGAASLLKAKFDPEQLSKKRLPYEALDQRLQVDLAGREI
jgi:hypothetical protein